MTLTYSVEKSERKTLSLILERNNDIVIKAPLEATSEKVEDFFMRKQIWIYTKLEEKKCLIHCPEKKDFVNWEWFYYLWRMYKLHIVETEDFKLRFYKNRFELNSKYIDSGKEIFTDWYKHRFNEKILPRVKMIALNHWFEYTSISVKDLKNKWGSCTPDNKLNFHWKIILAPVSVIEYIIIHELCHIKEKNHSPKFWDLVARYMPKYENHKEWLKRNWWEFVL